MSGVLSTKRACVECIFAWLLYGDGAICLLHRQPVYFHSGREAK